MAEKPGSGCQEEPSPGGMLARAGPAAHPPSNLRPPTFPDGVPGSVVAEGLRGLLVRPGPCGLRWGQVSFRRLLMVVKRMDIAPPAKYLECHSPLVLCK